jgi:deazaflavin-dependent oxidoreductase (nitroreductase family)
MGWPISDDRARAMYRGGRANPAARRLSRLWAAAFAVGLLPARGVTLEVPGRRSGRTTRFPLVRVRVSGQWYLVSMLGENCHWVRNVRAAGGHVTLRRRGRRVACRLVEVPVEDRAPILRQYVARAPGARPHIPVDRHAPVAAFADVASAYPVFRIDPAASPERG